MYNFNLALIVAALYILVFIAFIIMLGNTLISENETYLNNMELLGDKLCVESGSEFEFMDHNKYNKIFGYKKR